MYVRINHIIYAKIHLDQLIMDVVHRASSFLEDRNMRLLDLDHRNHKV